MASGYIFNYKQPVQWIPNGKKPSMFAFSLSDDGVELKNKFSMFKTGGYKAEAYYCSNCHIVVAPTER